MKLPSRCIGSSVTATVALLLVCGHVKTASAQVADTARCVGQTISRISIGSEKPPFSGSARKWQLIARGLGLHHATTRDEVIRAYLLFKEGDRCNGRRVAESMRMLRELPFLGNATATVLPDTGNTVTVDVRTVDEIPVLFSGALRHSVPAALSLGNENVGGYGLRFLVGGQRADVYRAGGRIAATDYAPFGKPVVADFLAQRDPLGGHIEASLTHRLLSNFQRGSWQASFRDGNDFPAIIRPEGDNEAVQVRDQRWSASGLIKIPLGQTVALVGPVALASRLIPSATPILLTDSGAVAVDDAALLSKYSRYSAARAGGLFGLRRVNYVSRTGLDALFAPQDVMTGWQVGFMAAPGMLANSGRDLLMSNTSYLGWTIGNLVLMGDLEGQARRDMDAGQWRSTVGNARVDAYVTPTSRLTIQVQDNLSAIGKAELPTQLTLGDRIGGARGYYGSQLAGGRRNVARTELRWASPNAIHGADAGVALFADVANLWKGDVPYGTNAARQSVGVSLLSSYPSRAKRLYRVDVAFPLERGRRAGIEIRFSNADPTIDLSSEPGDVTQARLAPIPASLFAWPRR
ncbi:MAG TPA: hypothetical protein VGM82_23970 [Gemmatimonadaceae bacterium]